MCDAMTKAITRHCNRLPGEVVEASSLGVLKVRLDGALSTLTYMQVTLFIAGQLD